MPQQAVGEFQVVNGVGDRLSDGLSVFVYGERNADGDGDAQNNRRDVRSRHFGGTDSSDKEEGEVEQKSWTRGRAGRRAGKSNQQRKLAETGLWVARAIWKTEKRCWRVQATR